MDTKLKNNKNRYIVSAIILIILVISSIGMYNVYPNIKKAVQGQSKNYYGEYDFLDEIKSSNYAIYYNMLNKVNKNKFKPSEILLENKNYEEEGYTEGYTKEGINALKKQFDKDINSDIDILDNDKNIDYYAQYYIPKSDTKIVQSRGENIQTLIEDKDIADKYNFFLSVNYDDKGDMSITKLYPEDNHTSIRDMLNDKNMQQLQALPIKNMTYVYAVPKELKYADNISKYRHNYEERLYEDTTAIYIVIALSIIALIALIFPYKFLRESLAFKIISKIPIEILTIIFFATLIFLLDGSYFLVRATANNDLIKLAQIELSQNSIKGLVIIINIIYWSLVFGVVFFSINLIKHIFKRGIKGYIKENSLIYKFLRGIFTGIKKSYESLKNIDLKEKNTKKIIITLLINFIILVIISCTWFFGIIIAIMYSIVLFKLIRKNYKDISDKYNKLHGAIKEIADGNLDISVEEDLGILNDLKNEVQNIQKGFKKAVQEEVKSQRMKTELISNVSHDLKTPLTAIITYVDLLKEDNLSKDKQKEYLEILDRKSQRLKDLIEDLFEVSKANSGNINLNIVDVDVVSLMKQTLLELDDKISKASLIIKANYPENKVILPLDSQRMFRVFENLIINITKYALRGSRVYIDIIPKEDKVVIVLKNMAADEINFNPEEIMERFVRGDKARNTEGSGLGLAIAKSFVELQGGNLDIQVDGDLFKVIVQFSSKQ